MEANTNFEVQMKINDNGYTYVFETREEMGEKVPGSKFRHQIWQVLPSICGSMMAVPFGMMLGWPSPAYPHLLTPNSTIPIDIDTSAVVAGSLMIGNILSTPFSSSRCFGAKYGVFLAVTLMTMGWTAMWQAKNLYWLLASRFLVGAGNGYGTGQLKRYITEICQQDLALVLTKQINLYGVFGVVMVFAFGPFVPFESLGIICLIVTIFLLFIVMFLPSTPRELLAGGKVTTAKRLVGFLSPHLNVLDEMAKIKQSVSLEEDDVGFWGVAKGNGRNLLVFGGLVFFQQFTGIASTIVYSQIVFEALKCPRPEFCALIYIGTYFLGNIYGLFFVPASWCKKNVLLVSAVGVAVLMLVQIVLVVEEVNQLWGFSSLVVMLFYNVFHTVGLGNVPVALIPVFFPKEERKAVGHFFVMFHSLGAILVTKIFQVIFDRVGLYAGFCLFLTIAMFSIVFVIIFVPKSSKSGR